MTMRESAHPRSRGENRETGRIRVRSLGSSPLTRGKHLVTAPEESWKRLIPAHAGKTPPAKRAGAASRAHPRSRGENLFSPFSLATRAGSSPLTRGKRNQQGCPRARRRLIPAHAGKTSFLASSCVSLEAHPRSRGENDLEWRILLCTTGSSPLTRGKRRIAAGEEFTDRLIPAHAGKTTTGRARSSCTQAHPRSRGENEFTDGTRHQIDGSSPLTRGKR